MPSSFIKPKNNKSETSKTSKLKSLSKLLLASSVLSSIIAPTESFATAVTVRALDVQVYDVIAWHWEMNLRNGGGILRGEKKLEDNDTVTIGVNNPILRYHGDTSTHWGTGLNALGTADYINVIETLNTPEINLNGNQARLEIKAMKVTLGDVVDKTGGGKKLNISFHKQDYNDGARFVAVPDVGVIIKGKDISGLGNIYFGRHDTETRIAPGGMFDAKETLRIQLQNSGSINSTVIFDTPNAVYEGYIYSGGNRDGENVDRLGMLEIKENLTINNNIGWNPALNRIGHIALVTVYDDKEVTVRNSSYADQGFKLNNADSSLIVNPLNHNTVVEGGINRLLYMSNDLEGKLKVQGNKSVSFHGQAGAADARLVSIDFTDDSEVKFSEYKFTDPTTFFEQESKGVYVKQINIKDNEVEFKNEVITVNEAGDDIGNLHFTGNGTVTFDDVFKGSITTHKNGKGNVVFNSDNKFDWTIGEDGKNLASIKVGNGAKFEFKEKIFVDKLQAKSNKLITITDRGSKIGTVSLEHKDAHVRFDNGSATAVKIEAGENGWGNVTYNGAGRLGQVGADAKFISSLTFTGGGERNLGSNIFTNNVQFDAGKFVGPDTTIIRHRGGEVKAPEGWVALPQAAGIRAIVTKGSEEGRNELRRVELEREAARLEAARVAEVERLARVARENAERIERERREVADRLAAERLAAERAANEERLRREAAERVAAERAANEERLRREAAERVANEERLRREAAARVEADRLAAARAAAPAGRPGVVAAPAGAEVPPRREAEVARVVAPAGRPGGAPGEGAAAEAARVAEAERVRIARENAERERLAREAGERDRAEAERVRLARENAERLAAERARGEELASSRAAERQRMLAAEEEARRASAAETAIAELGATKQATEQAWVVLDTIHDQNIEVSRSLEADIREENARRASAPLKVTEKQISSTEAVIFIDVVADNGRVAGAMTKELAAREQTLIAEIAAPVVSNIEAVVESAKKLEDRGIHFKQEVVTAVVTDETKLAKKCDQEKAVLFAATVGNMDQPKQQKVVNDLKTQAGNHSDVSKAAASAVGDALSVRIDTVGSLASPVMGEGVNSGAGLAAGDDDSAMAKGAWVSGLYGHSTKEKGKDSKGYSGSLFGGTLGFDISLTDNNLVGMAYSNVKSGFDYSDKSGKIEAASHSFSIYGQQQIGESIVVQGLGSYTTSEVTSKTKKEVANNVFRTATAKFNSTAISGEASVGYKIGNDLGLMVLPNIGVKFANYKTDGYKEKGAGIMNLEVQGSSSQKLAATAGVKIMAPRMLDGGMVVTPILNLSAENYFGGSKSAVKAKLAWMNNYFESKADKSDSKLGFNVGGGLMAKRDNLELSANYNCHIESKFMSHQGSLKLKLSF